MTHTADPSVNRYYNLHQAEKGDHAELAPKPDTYIADTEEVIAAKADFMKAFEEAEQVGNGSGKCLSVIDFSMTHDTE